MQAQLLSTDMQMINVADKGDVHNMADFPYGMALMVGYMRDQGLDTLMLQYPIWQKEEYIGPILDNPAYLYGFQVNYENYPDIQELVKIIKASNPEGKIVFGGPFVVSLYRELLKNDPNLDAVVLGEGEYSTLELVQKLKAGDEGWKTVRGLARLGDDGEVILNDHSPAIHDMNTMPFAARDNMELETLDIEGKYVHDVRITTSRGCTSNCSFCAVNVNSKWQGAKQWRGRSHIDVVDEIQEVVEKYNVKLINLQDSAFDDPGSLGARRSRLFCEELLNRGIEISMKAYFRAHAVKDDPESIELYKLYKEAGIDILHIGAEAGSEYELEVYWKDATMEDNFRSFRVFDDLDLFFVHNGFIMFGPYSNMTTLRQNIRFLWGLERCWNYTNLDTTLILTPGASMHDMMTKEGRVLPRENFWDVPAYEFNDSRVLAMTKHYAGLRAIYPHIDTGDTLVLTASNIISRLKNKMNKRVAVACSDEFEDYKTVFYKARKELNDLAYLDFIENLNRVEKDGANARLDSEPYFGKPWKSSVTDIQKAYAKLLDSIQSKGFGLGGLIFNAEITSWASNNREHFALEELSSVTVGDLSD
jgi:hypothetical protein